MNLTVGDLRMMLEGLDEDMEVRMASQPSWPFEYAIAGVTTKRRAEQADDDIDEEVPHEQDIAYIVEGEQLCYASKNLFNREARIFC